MDLSALTEPLAESTAIALIVLAVAICFVWNRTQSSHVFAFWLWRMLNRGFKLKDADVAAFLDEEQAVMAFRFATGLQVVSAEQARTCARFIRERNLDTTQIHAAKQYVRLEGDAFRVPKVPHRWAQRSRAALGIVCMAVMLAAVSGMALIDRPLLKFKDTGTWFLMTASSAERVPWFGHWHTQPLQASKCAERTRPTTSGLVGDDVARLCAFWQKPHEVSVFVADTLRSQRSSFGWLGLIAFALGVLEGAALRRGFAAQMLAGQLSRSGSQPTPLALAPDSSHVTAGQVRAVAP